MYIILKRNGYTFAADGMDYVVVAPDGKVVYRDMHKLQAEAEFRKYVNGEK